MCVSQLVAIWRPLNSPAVRVDQPLIVSVNLADKNTPFGPIFRIGDPAAVGRPGGHRSDAQIANLAGLDVYEQEVRVVQVFVRFPTVNGDPFSVGRNLGRIDDRVAGNGSNSPGAGAARIHRIDLVDRSLRGGLIFNFGVVRLDIIARRQSDDRGLDRNLDRRLGLATIVCRSCLRNSSGGAVCGSRRPRSWNHQQQSHRQQQPVPARS